MPLYAILLPCFSLVSTMKPQTDNSKERPPVVVVMGHIDHGKSTLLDYIRKTNIVAEEAGGITQRLSAYEVEHTTKDGAKKRITFLDTPGHEAFQSMRSRGAQVADIAILVVSAEDGVKAQTIEALKTIRESSIPYLVAINKIDKPSADVERAKRELVAHEIYLEGQGGTIPWVPISAKTGVGVDELLDVALLAAELEELRGNPEIQAEGVVIEATIDTKKGVSATLIIKNGTLKSGDFVIAGNAFAPVRIMENFLGKNIKQASFSSPVRVIGFSSAPAVGSSFKTVATKKEAEAQVALALREKASVEQIIEEVENQITLPVIIKADALGAVDAIEHELMKLPQERVRIRIVQRGVGSISEGDAKLASGSSNSIILGFNVGIDARAKEVAERNGITIAMFDIIYKIHDWFAQVIAERAPKFKGEEVLGSAKIMKVFSAAKGVMLLGGKVEKGKLSEGDQVRLVRRELEVGRGHIVSLQQGKSSVRKVEEGNEFGAQVKTNSEPAPGDTIESFIVVEK